MSTKLYKDRNRVDARRLMGFILENLAYDSEDGVIYMLGPPRLRIPVDQDDGNRPQVRIMGQFVLLAHVAFVLRTHNWPPYPLKHRNGEESDIRWDNLVLSKAVSVSDRSEDDEDEQETLTSLANDQFLAALRMHHPAGPPTYQIKSGRPIIFYNHNRSNGGYSGGSPAQMCADA